MQDFNLLNDSGLDQLDKLLDDPVDFKLNEPVTLFDADKVQEQEESLKSYLEQLFKMLGDPR